MPLASMILTGSTREPGHCESATSSANPAMSSSRSGLICPSVLISAPTTPLSLLSVLLHALLDVRRNLPAGARRACHRSDFLLDVAGVAAQRPEVVGPFRPAAKKVVRIARAPPPRLLAPI